MSVTPRNFMRDFNKKAAVVVKCALENRFQLKVSCFETPCLRGFSGQPPCTSEGSLEAPRSETCPFSLFPLLGCSISPVPADSSGLFGRNCGGSNHIEWSKSLDHGLTLLRQVGKDMKRLSISSRHSLFQPSSCWLSLPCPTYLLVHLFQPHPQGF